MQMLYIRFLWGMTYFRRSAALRLADSSPADGFAVNTSFFSTLSLTEKKLIANLLSQSVSFGERQLKGGRQPHRRPNLKNLSSYNLCLRM